MFGSKFQKCIMLGYSECSKDYKMYNIETNIIEESINVKFDNKLDPEKSKLDENCAYLKMTYSNTKGVQPETKIISIRCC